MPSAFQRQQVESGGPVEERENYATPGDPCDKRNSCYCGLGERFFLGTVTLDPPRGCTEDNRETLENRDMADPCTPGALCIESNVMSLAGRRGFCAVDAAHARPPLWGAGDICRNPPAGAQLILRQVSCKRSCVRGST